MPSIYIQDDSSLTICGSSFTRNKGLGNGGAVYAQESTLLLDGSTPNHFTHNSNTQNGGAIQCNYNCSLEMRGSNTFKSNNIFYDHNFRSFPNLVTGGALFARHAKVFLSGMVTFCNNTALHGGAVYLVDSYTTVEGEVEFTGNTAELGGGMSAIRTSISTINKAHMRFIDNKAEIYGAGIEIEGKMENREIILSASFLNNSAGEVAAVDISSAQITFVNTNITNNFGGALAIINSNITFSGLTVISENDHSFEHAIDVLTSNVIFDGIIRITRNTCGAIKAQNSLVTFKSNTIFDNNSNPINRGKGGALNCLEGKVVFQGKTLFIHNSATVNGGAIYASYGTSIYMQGIVNFTLNTAINGSAMYFDNEASLIFKHPTTLLLSMEVGYIMWTTPLCVNATNRPRPVMISEIYQIVSSKKNNILKSQTQ